MFIKSIKKIAAFSILEIIFAIAIISIIAIIAIPKFGNNLNKANLLKIKNDITLIREGLQNYKNKILLSNNTTTLNSLDDNNEELFNKILNYPIIIQKDQKATNWEKISNEKYLVWIDASTTLEFKYDKSNYTFDCDIQNTACRDLTQ
jgi:type II secretory pathway pseudopilin PulG